MLRGPLARHRLIVGLASTAMLALSACSLTLMKRPSGDAAARGALECTSGLGLPLTDAVLTVVTGSTAVSLHATASNPSNGGELRTAAWIATGGALALLASATYGGIARNRCIRALARAGVRREKPVPENRHPPGNLGGACLADGSCDAELICDQPMKTCVPLDPEQ